MCEQMHWCLCMVCALGKATDDAGNAQQTNGMQPQQQQQQQEEQKKPAGVCCGWVWVWVWVFVRKRISVLA